MIEPPIIPVREALGAVLDALAPGVAVMTAARWLEFRYGLAAVERAEVFLRTECATRSLTLIVIDPRTGMRHALPAAYFDRPESRFIFHRARFRKSDLDDRDPLYPTLCVYDGWATGFIEFELRARLARIDTDAEAMQGAFHPTPNAVGSVNVTEAEKPVVARPQKRGGYKGGLAEWMAQKDLPTLRRMGSEAIARDFKDYCERERPKLIPLLPKRLRSMEPEIERIIKRRLEAANRENAVRKGATKGQ
jgi:hypothetical protein